MRKHQHIAALFVLAGVVMTIITIAIDLQYNNQQASVITANQNPPIDSALTDYQKSLHPKAATVMATPLPSSASEIQRKEFETFLRTVPTSSPSTQLPSVTSPEKQVASSASSR